MYTLSSVDVPRTIYNAIILPTEVVMQGHENAELYAILKTFLEIRYSQIAYLIRSLERATHAQILIARHDSDTGVLTVIRENTTVAAITIRLLSVSQ